MTHRIGVFSYAPRTQNPSSVWPPLFQQPRVLATADIDWLFDVRHRRSLVRYWNDVSPFGVDIEPVTHHDDFVVDERTARTLSTVTLPLPPGGGSRGVVAAELVRVLSAHGRDLRPFDSLIFVLRGPAADAGAGSVGVGGRTVRFALLDSLGSHRFMAHEVGHAIGLEHPFAGDGMLGSPPNGEYGDPACIMSAEGFTEVGISIPEDERGPFPLGTPAPFGTPARGWEVGGPGVSATTYWRWGSAWPAEQPWARMLDAASPSQVVELAGPGIRGTAVVAMPVSGTGAKPQWCAVEYRPASGWDANLDASIGSGVFVYQVRDVGSVSDNVAGQNVWPKPDQVCTTGPPLGKDGNLDRVLPGFAARVLETDGGRARVLVGATLPPGRSVRLHSAPPEDVGAHQRIGSPATISKAGPTCTTMTFHTVELHTDVRVTVRAEAAGFADPAFRFEVNGVRVETSGWTWVSAGETRVVRASVELSGRRPTGLGTSELFVQPTRIGFWQEANVLSFDLPSGLGTVQLDVRAVASDDRTNDQASTTGRVEATTLEVVLPPEAVVAQTECVLSQRLEEELTWPPDEDVHPDWRQRLNVLASQVLELDLAGNPVDRLDVAAVTAFTQAVEVPGDLVRDQLIGAIRDTRTSLGQREL